MWAAVLVKMTADRRNAVDFSQVSSFMTAVLVSTGWFSNSRVRVRVFQDIHITFIQEVH